jgi:hypothetical protein
MNTFRLTIRRAFLLTAPALFLLIETAGRRIP